MLTPEDHERITAAVAKAEEGTSGDIFCVLAGEVSTYREVPIAAGAATALLIPPIVLAFGLRPLMDAITAGGWTASQASALPAELGSALTGYAVAQLLIFVALVERQVEVLADAAIHAKVGDTVWRQAADAVQAGMRQPDPTAGIEQAIAICGEALKAHFPSSDARTPDRPMDV